MPTFEILLAAPTQPNQPVYGEKVLEPAGGQPSPAAAQEETEGVLENFWFLANIRPELHLVAI